MKAIINIVSALLLFSSISDADEYAVISNKKMKDLSQSEIKAIFLKKITVIGDMDIVPVSLGASDPVREKFESEILNMSFARLKSHWAKQHYLGKRPPISMLSAESVKAFVKKVDGALGYIDAKNIDNDVKVLYRWRD